MQFSIIAPAGVGCSRYRNNIAEKKSLVYNRQDWTLIASKKAIDDTFLPVRALKPKHVNTRVGLAQFLTRNGVSQASLMKGRLCFSSRNK